MNKKQSKRQRDIKTKLMAAICMLLVSSIMMVSTTYAWFTLSTAPEVTGINTAVGANGNLEMALLPSDIDFAEKTLDEWITSGVGDSSDAANQPINDANITWGNLVDVGDNNIYGLNNITLYPSELNVATKDENNNPLTIAAAPLSTPKYGSDGRITELAANTLTGIYNNAAFSEGGYGVRAVGTSSSMSPRQLAYRNAMNLAASYSTQGLGAARASLQNNGAQLGNIVIMKATQDNPSYSSEQLGYLMNMVTAMEESIGHIENSFKQYIIAASVANATDEAYTDLITNITDADLYALVGGTSGVSDVELPEGIATHVNKLSTTKGSVNTAKSNLTTLQATAAPYTWDQIKDSLDVLVKYENMTLSSDTMTATAVKDLLATDGDGNYIYMGDVVNAAMSGTLVLTMAPGSGVYADIADFCGNVYATISLSFEYQGMPLTLQNVRLTTATAQTTVHLTDVRDKVTTIGNNANFASSGNTISSYYGYIIDLAFRTNAANSNLLLQTEAVDRIYDGNTNNEDTMGGGSSMSFKSLDSSFGGESIKNLMSAIRVVFFDPTNSEIIGYARLTGTPTEADEYVTMDLTMTDAAGAAITVDGEASAVITELEQNTAKAISVLVYLDGESVTNADVANAAAQSMVGTMNLQFSSSADLQPMEYADLRNGSGDADDDDDTPTTLTNVTSTSYTVGTAVYDGTNVIIQLTGASDATAVTVTIDGTAYNTTVATAEGVTGVTVQASGVTASSVITVEPATP